MWPYDPQKNVTPEIDILSGKLSLGVLSAFAAGTLVYVSMFEIIQREQSKDEIPGLVQLLFVLLGFTAILLFTRYGNNSWKFLELEFFDPHFFKTLDL